MRHVARTHRVNLDWLFERLNRDPHVFMKFVGTKEQAADILTKGSFTAEAWNVLCNLCLIKPISESHHEPQTKDKQVQVAKLPELLELNKPRACIASLPNRKLSVSMPSAPSAPKPAAPRLPEASGKAPPKQVPGQSGKAPPC